MDVITAFPISYHFTGDRIFSEGSGVFSIGHILGGRSLAMKTHLVLPTPSIGCPMVVSLLIGGLVGSLERRLQKW
jgi:hypothetical protein